MKSLFPYKTLFGDVRLSIDDLYVDEEHRSGAIRNDERIVELARLDRSAWSRATLVVSIAGPAGELLETTAPVAVVVVNCGRTETRQSTVLLRDDAAPGRWFGEIELDRAMWFGSAEVRGGIVATVDGEPHRIIGWGDPWMLEFDDLPNRPAVGGAIKITWVHFNEPGDDRQFLKLHADKPYFLRIDPSEPQLFLNSDFEGLQQLLADRRGRRGADLALHNQMRSGIADKTWTALFNAAIDTVEPDDEGNPSWPEIDWQRTVLETLLDLMFPEQTREEALRDAFSAYRERGGAELQERLAPAASTQARMPRLLREGIRLVTNEAPEEEEIEP
jgi:hypothetical protein